MNKQEFQKTIRNMKPPKQFTAFSCREAFDEGFETAKNEVLFHLCFVNEKQIFEEIANMDNDYKDNTTPTHYQGAIQPIDLINAQNLNFNLGNVVKYVCRSGKKKGESTLSDLYKAKDYIDFEIERVKNEQKTTQKTS